MSLQEYILAELVNNAALRSPAEIVAEVEREMAESEDGFYTGSAEYRRHHSGRPRVAL